MSKSWNELLRHWLSGSSMCRAAPPPIFYGSAKSEPNLSNLLASRIFFGADAVQTWMKQIATDWGKKLETVQILLNMPRSRKMSCFRPINVSVSDLNVSFTSLLGGDSRRHPGRPRTRWTDQLRNDTGSVPANLWRQAILRGQLDLTWLGVATRRPELATRWRRRRIARHRGYAAAIISISV